MLSSLVCCDYRIRVDCSSRSCACPIVLCVPSRVGASSKPIWDSLPLSPSTMKETLTQVTLTITRHMNITSQRKSRPLSYADKQELRQISMIMETGPSYRMGLPHQTVWGLVGTSYQGDPLNVGESSTVNTSGARRRVVSYIRMNILSHSFINHLVKVVTRTPSHLRMTLQLVTLHLPRLNTRFCIITFAPSIPSLASSRK